MKIYLIKIENEGTDEFADKTAGFRCSKVNEICDYIKANFTDDESYSNGTLRIEITPIQQYLPPDYKLNPDFHL